jgi:chromosome segregation ATPase
LDEDESELAAGRGLAFDLGFYVARLSGMILVADVLMWCADFSVHEPTGAGAVRALVAVAALTSVYYGVYAAKWQRTRVQTAFKLWAAACIGACSTVVVSHIMGNVHPRATWQILVMVLASTMFPLLGAYVARRSVYRTLLYRTLHATPSETMIRQCARRSSLATVAGCAIWPLIFIAQTTSFGFSTVMSSIVSFLVTFTTERTFRLGSYVMIGEEVTFLHTGRVVENESVQAGESRPKGTPERWRGRDEPAVLSGQGETEDETETQRVIYAPPFTLVQPPASTKEIVMPQISSKTRRRRLRKREYKRNISSMPTKTGIDVSGIVANEIQIALDVGGSLEQELDRLLTQRVATLEEMKRDNVNALLMKVVEDDIAALRAEVNRVVSSRDEFKQAQVTYESDLEMWMESIRAAAAVSRLDIAIDSLKSGKVGDNAQVKELLDQRAVWGLRLVSSQIHSVVELQDTLRAGEKKYAEETITLKLRIKELEASLTDLKGVKERTALERESLEERLTHLNQELDVLRTREHTAEEDWRKERIKLEVELEASFADLQTATKTVDEALSAKKQLLEELQDLQSKSDSDKSKIHELESETVELQSTLKSLSEQLSAANDTVERVNARKADLEDELASKVAQLAEVTANRPEESELVANLERQVGDLEAQLRELKDAKERQSVAAEVTLERRLAEAEQEFDSQLAQLESESKEEISKLKSEMANICAEMEKLSKDITEKTQQNAEYERRIRDSEDEVDKLRTLEREAADTVESSKLKLTEAQEAVSMKQSEVAAQLAQIQALTTQLAETEQTSLNAQRELSSSRDRVDELEKVLSILREHSDARDELITDVDALLSLDDIDKISMIAGSEEANDLVKRIAERFQSNQQAIKQAEMSVEELKAREKETQWFRTVADAGSKAIDRIKASAVDFTKEVTTASRLERALTQRSNELRQITSEPQYRRLSKSFGSLKKKYDSLRRDTRRKESELREAQTAGENAKKLNASLNEKVVKLDEELKYIRDLAKSEGAEHSRVVEDLRSRIDSLDELSQSSAAELVRTKSDCARLRGVRLTLEAELQRMTRQAEQTESELVEARAEHDRVIAALTAEITALELDVQIKANSIQDIEKAADQTSAALRTELKTTVEKLESISDTLNVCSRDLESSQSEKEELNRAVIELRANLEEAQIESSRLIEAKTAESNDMLDGMRSQLMLRETELEAKVQELSEKSIQLEALKRDLTSNTQALRDMEGKVLVVDALRSKLQISEDDANSKGLIIKELREQIANLDESLIVKDKYISDMAQSDELAASSIEGKVDTIEKLNAHIADLERRLGDKTREEALQSEIERLQSEMSSLGDARASREAELEAELESLHLQLEQSVQTHDEVQSELKAALLSTQEARESAIAELSLELEEKTSELRSAMDELTLVNEHLRVAEDRTDMQVNEARKEDAVRIGDLEAELASLRNALKDDEDERFQLQGRLREVEKALEDRAAVHSESLDEIDRLKEELSASQDDFQSVANLKKTISELKEVVKNRDKALSETIFEPLLSEDLENADAELEAKKFELQAAARTAFRLRPVEIKEREEQSENALRMASLVTDEIRAELSEVKEQLEAREVLADHVEADLRTQIADKDDKIVALERELGHRLDELQDTRDGNRFPNERASRVYQKEAC